MGLSGGAGSTIADSFISTSDDGIKIYSDIVIRNVSIEQHRNGAPIQFGCADESGPAKAVIENLTILGVDPQPLYNMAPFSWQGGTGGCRDVTVTGLKVRVPGKQYDEILKTWQPMALFALKPATCTLNITLVDADTDGLALGLRNTAGVLTVNGKRLP
jgi:hypothetical protein